MNPQVDINGREVYPLPPFDARGALLDAMPFFGAMLGAVLLGCALGLVLNRWAPRGGPVARPLTPMPLVPPMQGGVPFALSCIAVTIAWTVAAVVR